jgi:hypothetical protein
MVGFLEIFRETKNYQDASRSQTEAALIMFDQINLARKMSEKEQILKRIKSISLNVLKDVSRVDYAVGIICGNLLKWLVFKARKELIAKRSSDISSLPKDKQAVFFAMSEGEDTTVRQLKELMKRSCYVPPKFSQYNQLGRLH